PGPNNLYIVFTPPGDVAGDNTSNSVFNFLGYHSSFPDSNGTDTDYYAVIPDQDPTGPNQNLTPLGLTSDQGEMVVGSRYLSNAITDPDGSTGWRSSIGNPPFEVGDLVANQNYTMDNFQVQYDYSNLTLCPSDASGTGTNYPIIH